MKLENKHLPNLITPSLVFIHILVCLKVCKSFSLPYDAASFPGREEDAAEAARTPLMMKNISG